MSILNIMCPICNDTFNNADDVYSTNCGHLFHLNCLNDWRRRSSSCPQCRQNNPTTHKLYLSFDESSEDSEKQAEMELKLKTSNEKITQLLVQLSEMETDFFQLQKQFTTVQETKRELEIKLRQMKESEDNFMKLQGQYTESEEIVKVLQERINQYFMENERKSQELRLNILENESLKANAGPDRSTLSDSVLHERIKILEQKLKTISVELQKEITSSTQLSIENMKLKSYVKHLNEGEKLKNKNNERQNCFQHRSNKEENVIKTLPPKSKNDDNNQNNTILIKGLPKGLIVMPLELIVVNLATRMKLNISASDLAKVNFVDNTGVESSKAKLIAQFQSSRVKELFLSKKNILKKNLYTKFVIITEFMDEGALALFKYAKEKLQNKGFNCIFSKDNNIYAKKNKGCVNAILIRSKVHVDSIQQDEKSDEAVSSENNHNVDENYYQLD